MSLPPMQILLVDDDEVDAMMVQRAIVRAGVDLKVHAVKDGLAALQALRGTIPGVRPADPVVVLLDLNMPRMGGHEFLTELRNDPALSGTVVFVLSSSSDPTDIEQAYNRQVAGYMEKSSGAEVLSSLADILDRYKSAVHLPERPNLSDSA